MRINFFKVAVFSLAVFFVAKMFFFGSNDSSKQPDALLLDRKGQEFRAPASPLESKILERQIDFVRADSTMPQVENATDVMLYTNSCDYSFSSQGAVLTRIELKKHKNVHGDPLSVTFAAAQDPVFKGGTLLLAFTKEVPLVYQLEAQGQDVDGRSWVRFVTDFAGSRISKTFGVRDNSYVVDLHVAIESSAQALPQPKIIFDAPMLSNFADNAVNGFALAQDNKTISKVDAVREEENAWKYPTIFGVQTKYFVQALLAHDSLEAAQRGFFKRIDGNKLQCHLELPEASDDFATEMHFYIGPKTVADLKAADARLTGILDFGWFDWLCEQLIRMIDFFYGVVGNYGLAIALLALVIRLLLAPISFWARRSFNNMTHFEREHAAEIAAINRQFKDDWVKRGNELDAFYKKHGRSQTQKMFTFVPLFLEFPLVIASYKIFGNYVAFYNAPLALWITDLSLKDPWFVLPILFGAVSILRESLFSDQARQGQVFGMSRLLMPLILVVVFANFSSGLVLYVLLNSLFISLEALFYDYLLARS